MSFRIRRFVIHGRESALRAFCDVAIEDRLLVKGIRVVEGRHGPFVSMPRQRTTRGTWYDSIVPLTRQAREELHRVVLEAYRQALASGQSPDSTANSEVSDG
ncbi:MAG: hypothetical protein COV75_08245 [Candidatus Omnitrophica bacterium CG11_big_fil_rev_8_21_14_0_20_63_9]|nr:MAG: hypothetical protein COV75_08245 [Candidatus Omnitrophica bacterium CG11_big_fil_rev_8_21_14_0_20_63_9]